MAIGEFLMGKPGQSINVSTVTPQQEQLQKRLMDLLGPQLQGLNFGTQSFEPIAEQTRRSFRQKTIPSIMERFAGSDSLESSALPQMLGEAATDLETNLGALRSQYGMQQQGQLLSLLSMLMAPQFAPMYQPRQPGFFEAATPGVVGNLLKLLV